MSLPLLLAIESATERPSVALWRDGALLGAARPRAGRAAAEALLPAIDSLLREQGLGPEDLGTYAVSVGPGSFTGLRIGIATIKGLAFGSRCPVAPVSTLAALARAAGEHPGPVVALLDARRGELYAGAWLEGGLRPDPRLPEGLYRPAELAPLIPEDALLAGEGLALLEAEGVGRGLARTAAAPEARHVAVLGAELLQRGLGVEAAALLPLYGRRAAAEARRTGLR